MRKIAVEDMLVCCNVQCTIVCGSAMSEAEFWHVRMITMVG